MRQSFCSRSSAWGILLALSVAAIPVVGQDVSRAPAGARPAATTWRVSRIPWGAPDISGIFTNHDVNGVPFERPAEFGTREYFTQRGYAQPAAAAAG